MGKSCELIGYVLSGRVPPQHPRFQSERESGDRNFAIGYYLKEKKVSADSASSRSPQFFPFTPRKHFTVTLPLLLSSLQCFPEGTDMTSILDFYFQVHISRCCTSVCLQFLPKLSKLLLSS